MSDSKPNKTKECKHCMTLISRRAGVCPQCRNSLSAFSGIQGFVRTGAWLVTATVSLAFAGLEKAENLGLSKDLEAAGVTIASKEVQTEVLREAITKVAGQRLAGRMITQAPQAGFTGSAQPYGTQGDFAESESSAPPDYTTGSATSEPPQDPMTELEEQIAEVLSTAPIDRRKLKELERQKLQLELGL